MSVTMLINVNTANKEELKQIPGVGERVARLLIQFRSKKTKRRSYRHSPHSDSDTDSSVNRYTQRHRNSRKHPKALCFDGKTNWLSFKGKFDSYRKVMR